MEKTTSVSQRFIAALLCVSLMIGLLPFSALRGYASKEQCPTIGEMGGYLQGALQTIEKTYAERKFTAAQGHGFAAEQANNLSDVLRGEKQLLSEITTPKMAQTVRSSTVTEQQPIFRTSTIPLPAAL